ncbi:MAG: ribonuclease P protein component [Lachnospiraceae bacterium]|nr:ribonuclease P protein component [Lachnospiraceae bacterium]
MFVSLKKNYEFVNVYQNGNSIANRQLVVYILKNDRDSNRFGISVSKKVGNSVVRHRITRLIRESIRLNLDRFESGYDIVIVARYSVKNEGFISVEKSLLHLLGKHGLLLDKYNK